MKGKQIIAALVALVALGAYYYFFEVKKKAEDDKIKAASEKLLQRFDRSKVAGITLTNGDNELALKKTGTGWVIEKPVKAEASQPSVDSLLSAFESESYTTKIDNMNMTEAGITASKSRALFTMQDGSKAEVIFGADSPAGSTAYAERPGDTINAYLISGALKSNVKKTAFDMRFKNALKLDVSKVAKITVNLKDKKYTIIKESGAWKFMPATEDKLKSDRIEGAIRNLADSTAMSMEPATAANLAKYSLDPQSEYVVITADKMEERVAFGAKNEKKNSRYAKSTGQSDILELPEYAYTGVPKSDEIIDKRICAFEQSNAARLEASVNGMNFTAEKSTDGKAAEKWEIKKTNVDKKTLENMSASSVVSAISWLEYKAKVAPKAGVNIMNEYGLTPGNNQLSVYNAKGARLSGVLIGKKVRDRENVYVKVYETDKIYEVDASFVRSLNIPGLEAK